MIRMTKQIDYGIVLLTQLAGQGVPSTARELSAETRIPLPMVSKILKRLTREGFLSSHRGAKGGYRLARSPERVTLSQVIRAMAGEVGITECISAPGECQLEPTCRVRDNLSVVNRVVQRALERVSLVDMTAPSPESLMHLTGRLVLETPPVRGDRET
jgi:FeS assembly SUF system regulator